MNIIEYKINEDKLQKLISRAELQKLTDIKICLNYETFKMIEAEYYYRLIVYNTDEWTVHYMGHPFVIDKSLAVGEVKILGYKEKQCTRVTVYADGTPPKIENDTVEKIIVCIE